MHLQKSYQWWKAFSMLFLLPSQSHTNLLHLHNAYFVQQPQTLLSTLFRLDSLFRSSMPYSSQYYHHSLYEIYSTCFFSLYLDENLSLPNHLNMLLSLIYIKTQSYVTFYGMQCWSLSFMLAKAQEPLVQSYSFWVPKLLSLFSHLFSSCL